MIHNGISVETDKNTLPDIPINNENATHPNRRKPAFHFTVTAVAVGLLAFVVARIEGATFPVLVAASIGVIGWVAISDLRPRWLTRFRIPILDLKRLIIVTITAGIGAGLGLPSVNVSKDSRTRSQPIEALHNAGDK